MESVITLGHRVMNRKSVKTLIYECSTSRAQICQEKLRDDDKGKFVKTIIYSVTSTSFNSLTRTSSR